MHKILKNDLLFSKFIWIFLITVIFLLMAVNFYFSKRKTDVSLIIDEYRYQLGDIIVDLDRREISFQGVVKKDNGKVQFLIYLQGYKWLEEHSAIVSHAKLSDLQKAIALLDWEIWEEIIQRSAGYILETKQQDRLSVMIKYKNKEVNARDLVIADDMLRFSDFIFPGSLYFDAIALEGGGQFTDCLQCPLFPVEQKILNASFIRESGESGYQINGHAFPGLGQVVDVLIRAQDISPE